MIEYLSQVVFICSDERSHSQVLQFPGGRGGWRKARDTINSKGRYDSFCVSSVWLQTYGWIVSISQGREISGSFSAGRSLGRSRPARSRPGSGMPGYHGRVRSCSTKIPARTTPVFDHPPDTGAGSGYGRLCLSDRIRGDNSRPGPLRRRTFLMGAGM